MSLLIVLSPLIVRLLRLTDASEDRPVDTNFQLVTGASRWYKCTVCSCGLLQRTASPMNRLAYLLILLLISALVDDFWAAAPVLPSAPLADDDEYLPPQQQPQRERSASCQKPAFVGLQPQTTDFSLVRRGLPSEWNLTTPFTPPPLYVFTSLQI